MEKCLIPIWFLLSIGVRPTLQLAKDADLEIGDAGGLLVNSQLQTSDPDIFAAGDMVEIEHRVNGKKVRIPLAGPANRQGRIAAEKCVRRKSPVQRCNRNFGGSRFRGSCRNNRILAKTSPCCRIGC